jgi:hypothetical protein
MEKAEIGAELPNGRIRNGLGAVVAEEAIGRENIPGYLMVRIRGLLLRVQVEFLDAKLCFCRRLRRCRISRDKNDFAFYGLDGVVGVNGDWENQIFFFFFFRP